MKKQVKGIDLTLVVNDECEQTTRKVMNGALDFNKSGTKATFVEAAPRKAHTRNTKVWDGELLSMIVKPNGAYQVHTKSLRTQMWRSERDLKTDPRQRRRRRR